jgi:predicted Zn finger-like uncharacterized protein
MNLSERLERARKQRMLAPNGAQADERPNGTPADERPNGSESDVRQKPIEIVVLPIGLHSVVETHKTTTARAARRCPACQADGRIDLADLVGQREHLTCENCGAMWQISNADPAEMRD